MNTFSKFEVTDVFFTQMHRNKSVMDGWIDGNYKAIPLTEDKNN